MVESATALHDTQIAVAVISLHLQSEGQITSLARRFEEVGEWKGGGGELEMETGGGGRAAGGDVEENSKNVCPNIYLRELVILCILLYCVNGGGPGSIIKIFLIILWQ